MHTVLLTGATGFVGSHVLHTLVNYKTFRVICTVRTPRQGEEIQQRYPSEDVGYVVIPDLANRDAVRLLFKQNPSISHVIHLAAPWSRARNMGLVPTADSDYERDLIKPSIHAAEALIDAIDKHGQNVSSLVVGSCFASMQNDPPRFNDPSKVYTARDMNFISREEACRSIKSAAAAAVVFTEDAIWDAYYQSNCDFPMVVMAMPMVLGPVLYAEHVANACFDGVVRDYVMDKGDMYISDDDFASVRSQQLPDLALPFYVDVRDAAIALIRPLMLSACPVSRWFIAAGNISGQQVVDIAYEKVPALQNRLVIGKPGYGNQHVKQQCTFDISDSESILVVDYRSLNETVVDMYQSLLKLECI